MNHWGLQTIRAELLNNDLDLCKLVPENYYTGIVAGTINQGVADSELAQKLRTNLELRLTGRQRKASDVLIHIAKCEMYEITLTLPQAAIEKVS